MSARVFEGVRECSNECSRRDVEGRGAEVDQHQGVAAAGQGLAPHLADTRTRGRTGVGRRSVRGGGAGAGGAGEKKKAGRGGGGRRGARLLAQKPLPHRPPLRRRRAERRGKRDQAGALGRSREASRSHRGFLSGRVSFRARLDRERILVDRDQPRGQQDLRNIWGGRALTGGRAGDRAIGRLRAAGLGAGGGFEAQRRAVGAPVAARVGRVWSRVGGRGAEKPAETHVEGVLRHVARVVAWVGRG